MNRKTKNKIQTNLKQKNNENIYIRKFEMELFYKKICAPTE